MMETAVSNCGIKMDETTQVIQLIIHVPVFFFDVLFRVLVLLVFHGKQSKGPRVYVTSLVTAHRCLALVLPFKVSFQIQEKIETVADLKKPPLLEQTHECCRPCSCQQIHCN